MNTNWKILFILLSVAMINLAIFIYTGQYTKQTEVTCASAKIPHSEISMDLLRGSQLQIEKGVKGYRTLRQFHLDQLYRTIPNTPQLYQGTPDYSSRHRQIEEACKNLNITTDNDVLTTTSRQQRYGLVTCGIAKVASSFWRRVFNVLATNETATSFLVIDYSALTRKDIVREKIQNELIKNATKFMFCREPYGRLFSAYVSKLVLPNKIYWTNMGTKIVKEVRRNPTNLSLACGHDVTFTEMVNYFIQGPMHDVHFNQQYKKCHVCDAKYDVIGKMESFAEDTLYLLDSVGALNKDIRFYDFKEEHLLDNLIAPIIGVFKSKHRFSKCMSVHMILQRTWMVLQIRGLLDKTQKYPLTEDESLNITLTKFVALTVASYRLSQRGNKRDAFLQAYKQVPLEDMYLLRDALDTDLRIFGYPREPEDLFRRNDETNIHDPDFNYFYVGY